LTAVRLLTGAVGLVLIGWGIRLLLGLEVADLVDAGLWLAGGVIVHDAVVAPLVVLAGLATSRVLPLWARGPVVVVGVLVGTVTLTVAPTLGRFGAKPDDPFLLNRAYSAWWLVLTLLAVLGGAAVAWRARRDATRTTGP
jgi:hypothetical protein